MKFSLVQNSFPICRANTPMAAGTKSAASASRDRSMTARVVATSDNDRLTESVGPSFATANGLATLVILPLR